MKNKRRSKGIEDEIGLTAKGGENISQSEIRWVAGTSERGSSMERKRPRVGTGNIEDELHDVVVMTGVHQQGASNANQQSSMDIPDLGKLVVLVCDTNRESRQTTVELLRQCGYKVLMSSRGSVAFEMLEREYERGLSVDVILKSHDPPSSSAVAFLEHLRSSRKEYKDILVIVYSDREHQLDKQAMAACLSLGAVDLWVKPLRINEVGNIWTRVWQQKHKDGSLQSGRGDTKNGSGGTSQPSTKGSGKTNDVSAASENDKLRTNGVKIELELDNHHKRHHKHHKHHKHVVVPGQSSHHPDVALLSAGNGSSAKQSATPTAKKVPVEKRSSTRNMESNPTIEDAEVADALTFMKSQRSTDGSAEDNHHQVQGTDQSKDIKQNETQRTPINTASGGSTQFLAKLPFIAGHPAMGNYGQFPFPWIDGGQPSEESMKKQAMDFQRAWLEWQQQYQQAIQMNYAMQGGRCMWPSMKAYPQSFNGWGQGSGIPPAMNQNSSSGGGQSNFASTVSRDELIRLQAVKRYREKRNKRSVNASNKIRYKSRKLLADARPRVRGQFVQVRKDPVEDERSYARDKDSKMVEAKGVPQLQEKTSTIKTKGEDIPVTDSAKSKGADTTDRPSDSGSNSPQSQR
jgi:CheY-like chemotaxis protein